MARRSALGASWHLPARGPKKDLTGQPPGVSSTTAQPQRVASGGEGISEARPIRALPRAPRTVHGAPREYFTLGRDTVDVKREERNPARQVKGVEVGRMSSCFVLQPLSSSKQ